MSTFMHAVELLEGRGHTCRIAVLYKGLRRDLVRDRAIARERFPHVAAPLDDFDDGIRPSDAVVATAWPTAYALRASGAAGVPFYLVQDHEPSFYAVSSDSVLAEQTYGFGFYGITAGRWLASTLERDHDMACTAFDLGVDLDCYTPPVGTAANEARDGVVFYARPDTPRRGYELGMAALALVAARHPESPIHLVGQDLTVRDPGFEPIVHGRCAPQELAAIYQRCAVGLVLSLTNLSLLPAELLATGCIPVMNDGENVRASFDNPWARLVPPRPDALAAAISEELAAPRSAVSRAEAAASVGSLGWPAVADRLELALDRGMDRWRQVHEPPTVVGDGDGERAVLGAVDLRTPTPGPVASTATSPR
jgi:glycosyltransferase involved in cell wall biosynthesis